MARCTDLSGVLISVVVPIYNVEEHLDRCLRSVLDQSYNNLEVILIDDGSTDGSGAICDSYAAKDHRVKVVHTRNSGVANARNVGLETSTAEFITFIDGDDWISKNYITNLFAPIAADPEIGLVSVGYQKIGPNQLPNLVKHELTVDIVECETALRDFFLQKRIATAAWGKLYRIRLFEGVRFPTEYMPEDFPVTLRAISRSSKIAIVNTPDYFYVQHPKSYTSQARYTRRLPGIAVTNEAVEFVSSQHPQVLSEAQVRAFMEVAFLVGQISSDKDLLNLSSNVEESMKKYRKSALVTPGVPLMHRAYAVASLGGIRALSKMVRFSVRISGIKARLLQ